MDEAAKKAVLRLFTYGLYVVTCRHGEQQNAFTANWLTQVSFDPPLLALSVENDAVSLGLIRAAGVFAVCVLESGQRDLAGALGRSLRRAPAKLDDLQWLALDPPAGGEQPARPPILAQSLGFVCCTVQREVPAGDSTLLLAQVYEAQLVRTGEPLTMREAGFRHSG
ncbi:MAG TPA: flavin reductase family protein [Chloroflexota bacterium]|jgi:flavin reductase (DIM6/NTAB) family NADH-FMN oxidoreductase RutF|nr:flavin reductase family protein [Chloroflexota bacterium]